jgi:toxin ParE1/3/4
MKVHWTDTAEGHLHAIYAYIAQDSPEYARRMVDRLTRRSQQIAKFLSQAVASPNMMLTRFEK